MQWGDIFYDKNEDCLKFNERQTKTRTGSVTEVRSLQPKAFRNASNPNRCPVRIFQEFEKRRPEKMCCESSPFYLAIKYNRVEGDEIWYKNAPLGHKSIAQFMKSMATAAGIPGRKTNHSLRKMMTTELLHAGFTPTHIKALTGHKNEASIANYAVPSKRQHREMSEVLMNNQPVERTTSTTGLPLAPTTAYVHPKPLPTSTESKAPQQFMPQGIKISTPQLAPNNLQDIMQGVFYGADCRNCTVNLYVNTRVEPPTTSPRPKKKKRLKKRL